MQFIKAELADKPPKMVPYTVMKVTLKYNDKHFTSQSKDRDLSQLFEAAQGGVRKCKIDPVCKNQGPPPVRHATFFAELFTFEDYVQ